MNKELEFSTTRQFCKKYPKLFSEHALRIMEKQGRIPGVYIGNRFMINEKRFFQQLENAESEEQANRA